MSNRLKHALTISAIASLLAILAAGAFAQTDDEIRELVAKAGEAKDYPDAGFVAVFEKIDVAVEESGLAHYRRHTLTKILTDEGALARAALRFDYDPASNFIDVESVRIFRREGAVETIDLATVRDLFAPASMIYWGARMKVAQLPRLAPGDAVEVKTYKKGFEIAYLAEGEGSGGGGSGVAPSGAGETTAGGDER
ncbi:MAG: DUF3857 domain-containing protein, partial [Candidatus Krumholzibacteria bacterium]|nr:DUF3857 domain-containing protein [Candidatus Krumholzibacteria bacterium]